MKKILFHIPHSSRYIPNEFLSDYLIEKDLLRQYNLEMSDLYVDKLFDYKGFDKLIFPFSRLLVDVEKFLDEKEQEMSSKGMGALYTKVYDGVKIRNSEFENSGLLIEKIYKNHHKKLDDYTEKVLNNGNDLLIIDCHSFSDSMIKEIFGYIDNPDICIGFYEEFKEESLINEIKHIFEENNYSVKFNYPYKGSIIPNYIFNNSEYRHRVKGIMIEINKRTYLDEYNQIDECKFNKLKNVLLNCFYMIEK